MLESFIVFMRKEFSMEEFYTGETKFSYRGAVGAGSFWKLIRIFLNEFY